MKKKKFSLTLVVIVLLALAILFVVRFSGHAFLRMYVEAGIGSCRKIPILCMTPSENLFASKVDHEFTDSLIPYKFPGMDISMPKGFAVVKETIKKVYYKRKKRGYADKVAYILHKPPLFFVSLYPQLQKVGVKDDYEFIKRTMHANLNKVKNITDAFFVIMKGIFIPDMGDQTNVKMIEFQSEDKRGFINYNLSRIAFDCNIIKEKGGFFKVYIKDVDASLDLDKVLAIINTISEGA